MYNVEPTESAARDSQARIAPWRDRTYRQIAGATRVGDDLRVMFVNGDVVSIAGDRFAWGRDPAWHVARNHREHLVIRGNGATVEVPWDVLRSFTDPAFADFMAGWHAAP